MGKSLRSLWRHAPRRVLVALLVVDVVFVSIHAVGYLRARAGGDVWDFLYHSPWSLGSEVSIGEYPGYLELAAAVVALWLLRDRVYRSWALVFALILIDDAGMVHERTGEALDSWSAFPDEILGVPAQSIGELAAWAVLGLAALVALALAHLRGESTARGHSKVLFTLLAALVFCAVALDQVATLSGGRDRAALLGLMEDGGEQVVLTLIAVAALALHRQVSSEGDGSAPPPKRAVSDSVR